jgi:hypothetical protein
MLSVFLQSNISIQMQNIYGARISNFEPEKKIIVTLVWPSLVLYNRVGNCTLKVIALRPTGEDVDDTRTMSFNTTINTQALSSYLLRESRDILHNSTIFIKNLAEYFNEMKKSNGYKKCESEDLDPFNKCKPVNCEEKYFGKRNFFKDLYCVPATICDENDDSIYDYATNECRSLENILSEEDLSQMQSGNFTNWVDAKDEKETHFEDLKVELSFYSLLLTSFCD